VQSPVFFDLYRLRFGARVVKTDHLYETTVAGRPRVCYYHPVTRLFLSTYAAQSDFDHNTPLVVVFEELEIDKL